MKTTNVLLVLILVVLLALVYGVFSLGARHGMYYEKGAGCSKSSSTHGCQGASQGGCTGGCQGGLDGGCQADYKHNPAEKHAEYADQFVEKHNNESHTYVSAGDLDDYDLDLLSEEELADIIHLRQEEKLARDVYRKLGETYQIMQFQNIPNSEQKHVDAMEMLIERYQLEDPITDEAFTDLFNELTETGAESLVAALTVGATIEDMNMGKLLEAIETADNADLLFVYESVLEQSKHHMQAFIRGLTAEGETYTPTYVSQEYFDEVVGSSEVGMQRGK